MYIYYKVVVFDLKLQGLWVWLRKADFFFENAFRVDKSMAFYIKILLEPVT